LKRHELEVFSAQEERKHFSTFKERHPKSVIIVQKKVRKLPLGRQQEIDYADRILKAAGF